MQRQHAAEQQPSLAAVNPAQQPVPVAPPAQAMQEQQQPHDQPNRHNPDQVDCNKIDECPLATPTHSSVQPLWT